MGPLIQRIERLEVHQDGAVKTWPTKIIRLYFTNGSAEVRIDLETGEITWSVSRKPVEAPTQPLAGEARTREPVDTKPVMGMQPR
jgi:hypothetical protein